MQVGAGVRLEEPGGQAAEPQTVPAGVGRQAPYPSQKPSPAQLEEPASAQIPWGSTIPAGTAVQLPSETGLAQVRHRPEHDDAQQIPCSQCVLRHSLAVEQRKPANLRPQEPAMHVDGGAHSAFDDPNTPRNAPPRESIETRTFAFWD